jgi:copper(I)-binding protein
MKTSVSILAPAILAAMLALSGCHHHRAAPAGSTANSPGMVVSQARLVLPAVKGNPGGAYFTLGNENSVPTALVSVDIVGVQKTEMHQTSGGTMGVLAQVGIDPGQRVIFTPGGKHVMAFNVAPSLTPGGSSEIIFHFQDGKTTSAPLRIEAAGDGSGGSSSMGGDMGGMNMGGKP